MDADLVGTVICALVDGEGVPVTLGAAATLAVGTTAGTVAAGDHTHPGGSEAFPVGALFFASVATNPATLLGYGTWAAWGAGRVFVCYKAGDSDFGTLGAEGGAKTHALTEAEMPSHTHAPTDPGHTHLTQRYPTATGGSSGFTIDTSMSGTPADNTLPVKAAVTGITIGAAGGGDAHPILQPFKVGYAWERIA